MMIITHTHTHTHTHTEKRILMFQHRRFWHCGFISVIGQQRALCVCVCVCERERCVCVLV